ncbi:SDR family NAD(P)-dependent oxidoreductase [Halomonas sp. LS-001]
MNSAPRSQAQCILITGATGAIGGALAMAYAKTSNHLILHGRRREVLEHLAERCRDKGAEVTTSSVNLTDSQALAEWLTSVNQGNLPDVAILNAGQNTHPVGAGRLESLDNVTSLIDINLRIPVAMTHHLVPAMRQRGSGQLVFISSLAGWHGLPNTPTYSATKAGIKAYGEGLRGLLEPVGIGVTVIMPGYVTSPMCKAMPGPKPFEIPAHKAAAIIQRGIERNKARVSFPFPLNMGTWWLAVLPAAISQRIIKRLGFDHTQEETPNG